MLAFSTIAMPFLIYNTIKQPYMETGEKWLMSFIYVVVDVLFILMLIEVYLYRITVL
jgi:hypothetical protein